jgi:predicted Zn-dependent protease
MKTRLPHCFPTLVLSVCLFLFMAGCAIVPETGRKQVMLVSGQQETQLGLTSFDQLKKEQPISKDAAATALVQKVGKRIAAVAPLPNAQWEFVVFESKEANAFCLPGGKVGVYTGLLPISRDEAGLATVIGHEVAHAVAHHGAERMSQEMLRQRGGELLASGLSNSDPKTQALVTTVYGLGTQIGAILPYSRLHESEADNMGLTYMARAGYDPEAAVGFWQRFAQYSKQSGSAATPNFLRTHPVDETRIQQLQQLMPRAKAEYQKATSAARAVMNWPEEF